MLKRIDPSNPVLVSYLESIDTSVETGILLPQTIEKKSKKAKKNDARYSGTKVQSSKSTKQVPVIEPEPIQPEPIIPDTQVTEKEVIPSKTGVLRRIKMNSKHKHRSSSMNVVRKPQVSHQGVIFRVIPAPASPSSKKRLAADMAKQLSKKKKQRVILTSESTAEEGETIPETPKTVLFKDSSHVDTSVITPPQVSISKTVTLEARTSGIPVNISDMDKNVIMGKDDSNKATQDMEKEIYVVQTEFDSINKKVDIICEAVTKFAKLYESLSPLISQLSTNNNNKNFMEVFTLLKEHKSLSSKSTASMLSSEDLIHKFSKFEELLI
ncbi:unnamed protein product [Lactuca saligna]|uniref:Uncharacterized protein n=1 Tax=Lactuca saligna TaxID=75948 RepID=A0AA36E4I1_LACSI|nr:unnamed protein product [Lactuca saligna]